MQSYVNKRPSALPAIVAPSAAWVMPAADAAQLPQMRQAPARAEFAPILVCAGVHEVSGFAGAGIPAGKTRLDVRGVPPRGRPV